MLSYPATTSKAWRHLNSRRVTIAVIESVCLHCTSRASPSRFSRACYSSQSNVSRQQVQEVASSSSINNEAPTPPSKTQKYQAAKRIQLRKNDRKRAKSLTTSSRIDKQFRRAVSNGDVQDWRVSMAKELYRQYDGAEQSVARSTNKDDSSRRLERAAVMAQKMDSARSKQLKASPTEYERKILASAPLIPGLGAGTLPAYVKFEKTEIVYPPSDVYPPLLPSVCEIDLITSARALGVLRSSDIEWDTKIGTVGGWRKTTRSNEYFEQAGLPEYLDNEQALEYLGDSALHLISRSLIMTRFTGKTVSVYNLASSWLVSNDCFAYMFEDAGLDEERIKVSKLIMALSKKRELEQTTENLKKEEYILREKAPLPEPILPVISHLRKADLLEAYVGAIYLTYGFTTTSKWCTLLLAPWLDLIDRTADFHQDRFLSPSGEARKRALLLELQREKEEKRRTQSWWGRMRSRFTSSD